MRRVEAIILNAGTSSEAKFHWDQSPWVAYKTTRWLIQEGKIGADRLDLIMKLPFRLLSSSEFVSLADIAEVAGTTIERAVETLEELSTSGLLYWSDAHRASSSG